MNTHSLVTSLRNSTRPLEAALLMVAMFLGLTTHAALIGHWTFDEGAGTTATDEVGSYVASGSTGWAADGKSGNAVSSPALLLDSTDSLTMNTVDSLTVSLWVRLDNAQGNYTGIAGFEGTGANPDEPYGFKMTGQTLQWGLYENYSVDSASFFDTYGTNWAHIVGTYNNVTGATALYINGALADSATLSTNRIPSSTRPFGIGRYGNSTSYNFDGDIDDLQVYDTALALEDIVLINTYPGNDLETIITTIVPEPSTIILAGLGLLGVCFRRRG